MLALLSENVKYNQIIETFIAISPITRIGTAQTPFRGLLANLKPLLQ